MDQQLVKQVFTNKRILITGGLGSIGSEIIKQLTGFKVDQIIVYDNRETALFYENQKYQDLPNIMFVYGDIKDRSRLNFAMENVDIVFHAAAMKHVTICEMNPQEAVKTNVIGTENVIALSIAKGVEKMILISTDKAVNPQNVMGTTKLLAERIVSATCNNMGKTKTKFGVVRFGNVLASRGSVIEIWRNQLKQNQKITITNPNMTRFFMSIPDSVRLIFEAAAYAENGEIFVLKMPAIRIIDLAKAFLKSRNQAEDAYIITGKKRGEKMHEELITEGEAEILMENNDLFVKLPLVFDPKIQQELMEKMLNHNFKKSDAIEFSSNNDKYWISEEQILKEILTLQER